MGHSVRLEKLYHIRQEKISFFVSDYLKTHFEKPEMLDLLTFLRAVEKDEFKIRISK